MKTKIIELLTTATNLTQEEVHRLLTIPPDTSLGDYAFPCFKLGKNPHQAAQKLKEQLGEIKGISATKVVGPYLNFFVDQVAMAQEVLAAITTQKDKYGKQATAKETIMVEFFHANTHKGVHIGHLRNISLGSAIANLLEAVGKKVIRVNYQGDIGPHVAKCLWGYQRFNEQEPKEFKGIWLGKIYAKASNLLKEQPELKAQVKSLNTKIYQHDKEVETLWQKTRQWCLDDFNAFYKDFGVKYERLYFESEAAPVGKQVFLELLEQGVAKKSDGAIIVDLEKYGLAVYVGVTSMGNPTYQGKELGLAKQKITEFSFDKSVHVVGSEQELFFKQVFKTYELMGHPLAGKSTHVSYGLVNLPEGKMSSRLGTMILYQDLFEKALEQAKAGVRERHETLSEQEVEQRAKMITFGALKYSMIARENHKTFTFHWDNALAFEGDTGPYIQYAHARCSSILRKANKSITTDSDCSKLASPQEKKVIIHLSKFSETILNAATEYKPYFVAKYLLDLAQYFNEFYHSCPVISEDEYLMHARLLLVHCVKQVLANGLEVLGIAAPEEM